MEKKGCLHAHEPDADYADTYHLRNSILFKHLQFSMFPTVPIVFACFSAFLAAIPGTGIACDQGRCIFGNNRCVWLTNVPQNAV
jgi:hypothetical protein